MTYRVYFELYGKKMVANITAVSEKQAVQIIKEKIIFHKVSPLDDELDNLMNIFGIKNPFK